MADYSNKKHIKNFACPSCSKTGSGSSAALYRLADDKEVWICYEPGCPTKNKYQTTPWENRETVAEPATPRARSATYGHPTKEEVEQYPVADIVHKGIRADTLKYFGDRVSYNEVTGEVDTIYYRYQIKNMLAGWKVKGLPKEWKNSIGSTKGVDPAGWHLLKPSKKVIITEGEDDRSIVHQVLNDHFKAKGYNSVCHVISLPHGSNLGDLLETKGELLKKMFKEVVLCFDQDKPGQDAVDAFVTGYDPTRVLIMNVPGKDANEAYLEYGPDAIITAFYDAAPPDLGGMVSLRDCLKEAYTGDVMGLSYPWSTMTQQSGGSKAPEMFLLMGASGGGKTDIATEMARHFAVQHKLKVNFYSLEMSLKKSARRLISKHVGRKQLAASTPEQEAADLEALGDLPDLLSFYDIKKGMLTSGHLINLIRQQTVLKGVKVHFIDNLSQLTAGKKAEKEAIDQFILDLKDLTEKYELRIFLLAHLNRNVPGKISFECGAKVGTDNLYGSGHPHKWADTFLAVERNQFHSDPNIRNTTICRWLKTRDEDHNATGLVFALKYSSDTSCYTTTDPIDIIEREETDDEERENRMSKNRF